jgi:undecaprenyl-diphosphatase
MLQSLIQIDQRFFLFLNGIHNPFFDTVMYTLTHFLVWVPLYLLLLYLVIREYKWQTLVVLGFLAIMILVSDQLCNIIKEAVHRFRPSNDPALTAVHIVDGYRGGTFGFYSAHASNNFAIAVFLILLIGKRFRYVIPIVLVYACLISYTRIYLGVHYPGDTIAGALAGVIIGFVLGKLCLRTIYVMNKPKGFSSPLSH